jgi:hypothetical protein
VGHRPGPDHAADLIHLPRHKAGPGGLCRQNGASPASRCADPGNARPDQIPWSRSRGRPPCRPLSPPAPQGPRPDATVARPVSRRTAACQYHDKRAASGAQDRDG